MAQLGIWNTNMDYHKGTVHVLHDHFWRDFDAHFPM